MPVPVVCSKCPSPYDKKEDVSTVQSFHSYHGKEKTIAIETLCCHVYIQLLLISHVAMELVAMVIRISFQASSWQCIGH